MTQLETPGPRRRALRRSLCAGGIAAAFVALCLWAGAARAHIVPPEKHHPAAAAYLRAVFFMNLTPIPWRELRAECSSLAHALRAHGAEDREAQAAIRGMQKALAEGIGPHKEGEEPDMDAYRLDCFAACTRGLSWLTRKRLADAGRALADHSQAGQHLKEARQLYRAFEEHIQAADPEGHVRLGQGWLECTGALGYPGIGGLGRMEPDAGQFQRSAEEIASYLRASYEDGKRPEGRSLAPVPRASPSYSASRPLPIRLPPGSEINKQNPRPRQVLNMAVRGVSEMDTYLVALGDMAFDSPFIFGEPARSLGISCNTCHNKGTINPNFFVPGLSHRRGAMDVSGSFFNPRANNGHADSLDIPDMRGIRFTAPYGRNGRFNSLREFTRNVIVAEFNGAEPDPEILDGLVAYMFEFDFLPNPLLRRDGTLSAAASPEAKRGEALFNRPFVGMGNRSCASCHIPSAQFVDRRSHDIGTGAPAEAGARDTAFDTPTLLSAKYTAPYMHDGSLPTLHSVSEWFNRKFRLGLTPAQVKDLTAYVEAVGSGVDAYEEPGSIVEPELEEFSFFMSTLEQAIPARKRAVVLTTVRTVGFEIRAHKWDLRDLSGAPVMDQMADLCDAIERAVTAGNWETAMARYREYVALYHRHKDRLT